MTDYVYAVGSTNGAAPGPVKLNGDDMSVVSTGNALTSYGLTVSPDGLKVYTVSSSGVTLTETTNMTIVATNPATIGSSLTLNPNKNRIYVCGIPSGGFNPGETPYAVITADTLSTIFISGTLQFGGGPQNQIGVSEDGETVLMCSYNGLVYTIDPLNGNITRIVTTLPSPPLPKSTGSIILDKLGQVAYIVQGGNGASIIITKIRVNDGFILAFANIPYAEDLFLSDDETLLYAANAGTVNTISVVRTSDLVQINSITLPGFDCDGLAHDKTGAFFYAGAGNRVHKIRFSDYSVISSSPVLYGSVEGVATSSTFRSNSFLAVTLAQLCDCQLFSVLNTSIDSAFALAQPCDTYKSLSPNR